MESTREAWDRAQRALSFQLVEEFEELDSRDCDDPDLIAGRLLEHLEAKGLVVVYRPDHVNKAHRGAQRP